MTRREAWPAISGLMLAGCDKLLHGTGAATVAVPPNTSELELDYSILLNEGSGRIVNDKHPFKAGDRFRVQFRPAFPAHVYLVNRGASESDYTFLYPNEKIASRNPLPAGQMMAVPAGSDWYTLDDKPGVENLVLIAATAPLTEFQATDAAVPRDDFESNLAMLERDRRPSASRRVEDKDWVRLFAARDKNSVILVRLPIDHR